MPTNTIFSADDGYIAITIQGGASQISDWMYVEGIQFQESVDSMKIKQIGADYDRFPITGYNITLNIRRLHSDTTGSQDDLTLASDPDTDYEIKVKFLDKFTRAEEVYTCSYCKSGDRSLNIGQNNIANRKWQVGKWSVGAS